MIILYAIVFIYFLLLYSAQIFQLIILWLDKPEPLAEIREYPMISVLLAVRNEEENILECLRSLDQLDWPQDKIEVLIGNDGSTDNTETIVRQFISHRPWFKLFEIKENLGQARGKANVLAHLAHKARGEFFFVTDADIRVTRGWAKGLYGSWQPGYGNINGITLVKENNQYLTMQSLDWIHAFAQMRVLTNLGQPITAVGNNMMVTREAYFSTGGYENIPFSITEDYELFKALIDKGWKHNNLLCAEALAYTEPIIGWKRLFYQRKRWMTGAFQLPASMLSLLLLQGMFLPFLLYSLTCFPIGILLWAGKALLDFSFIKLAESKIGVKGYVKGFLIRELCLPWVILAQVIYFVLPGSIDWKGRKYKK